MLGNFTENRTTIRKWTQSASSYSMFNFSDKEYNVFIKSYKDKIL